MTASEKLKALDAAFRPAAAANFGEEFDQHYARQKAQDSLRLALPQIVALVKAAQDVVENHSEFTPGTQIARALAALEEQLQDLGSATGSETPTPP